MTGVEKGEGMETSLFFCLLIDERSLNLQYHRKTGNVTANVHIHAFSQVRDLYKFFTVLFMTKYKAYSSYSK